MFRHIVLVRLSPVLTDDERAAYRAAVERLGRDSPTVRSSVCAPNVGTGPNHYDFAAVTDFDDEAGFRTYLASEAHRSYVENYGKLMVTQLAVVQQQIEAP
jgi:hypothetical protein